MDFPLKDSERTDPYQLHKATKEKKYGDRIKIILLLDKGYTQREISDILMIDEDTIILRMVWAKVAEARRSRRSVM